MKRDKLKKIKKFSIVGVIASLIMAEEKKKKKPSLWEQMGRDEPEEVRRKSELLKEKRERADGT